MISSLGCWQDDKAMLANKIAFIAAAAAVGTLLVAQGRATQCLSGVGWAAVQVRRYG